MTLAHGILIASVLFSLFMWLRERYRKNKALRDVFFYAALITMLAEVEMRKEQARRDP